MNQQTPAGRRPAPRVYALMDLTVYGRQEPWEDSPAGWPQQCSHTRTNGGPPDWPPVPTWPGGRPIAQWSRLEAGRSDGLAVDRELSGCRVLARCPGV
jgi:hypothetical protein